MTSGSLQFDCIDEHVSIVFVADKLARDTSNVITQILHITYSYILHTSFPSGKHCCKQFLRWFRTLWL